MLTMMPSAFEFLCDTHQVRTSVQSASSTTRREMNTSASPGEDSAMQKWASAG
eukprot:CAMPEP_0180407324 /NCGR_PEP_ID=MMETSP0989-20121125/41659_1 /TAXON_ID=697907 /ORGANISM="non described non described, Strain CCMP2293" /LENGTH=52 /DNA_ID=CAMNT_0022411141 /DNA_START=15 /DNA_END=173 /DNA_ORIENTATION=-